MARTRTKTPKTFVPGVLVLVHNGSCIVSARCGTPECAQQLLDERMRVLAGVPGACGIAQQLAAPEALSRAEMDLYIAAFTLRCEADRLMPYGYRRRVIQEQAARLEHRAAALGTEAAAA